MAGLTSLSRALAPQVNERKASAALVGLKSDGRPQGRPLRFQYWPASIGDSKAVNWTPREIPGGSLPIYQWISSGERLVSFNAEFSCDVDIAGPDGVALVDRLKAAGESDRNVDIRTVKAWLRQFQLPTTAIVGGRFSVAKAPARCRLFLPNTGIGIAGGLTPESQVDPDSIACILLSCDVTEEGHFPSGLPRYMSVSLSWGQTPQASASGPVVFPGAEGMETIAQDGLRSFAYDLPANVYSHVP